MGKIIKNITLTAVLVIAGSGFVPAYSRAIGLPPKTENAPKDIQATDTLPSNPESLGSSSWVPAVLSLALGTVLAHYHANDKNDPASSLHSKMTFGFSALPLVAKVTNYDRVLGAIPVWGILTSEMFGLLSQVAKNPSTCRCFGWASRISKIAEDPIPGIYATTTHLFPKLNPLNWLQQTPQN